MFRTQNFRVGSSRLFGLGQFLSGLLAAMYSGLAVDRATEAYFLIELLRLISLSPKRLENVE